jgi:uncharacterized membrane protein YjgN (DUF898 family)
MTFQAVPPAPAAAFPIRFTGDPRAYWRLLVRGAVLLMLTLGIYRFWLTTDIRSYLVTNTEVAGDSLEYSGTAIELLTGFLVAVAILLPVYAAFFLAALDLGPLAQTSGAGGFLMLFALGQYAVYRARRYRLTRTLYRGLRFHQEGSALRYALCATLWWGATIATLGLALPWKESRLERFKMRHTFYGDLPCRFEGRGFALFLRGLPLWLMVMLPLALSVSALAQAFDTEAVGDVLAHGGDDMLARLNAIDPELVSALGFAIAGTALSVALAVLLFPAFQALRLRWWSSGLRLGPIVMRSHLRTAGVYRAYLRFVGYVIVFALALALGAVPLVVALGYLLQDGDVSILRESAAALLGLGGYVVAMLGLATLYRATVMLALWRLTVETLALDGLDAAGHVRAAGRPGSPVGEGLADVLHVGGL